FAAAAAGGLWAVMFGPLRGHLGRMDAAWASVLAGKDYIFPSDWGPSFWLVNFGYIAVAAAIYEVRRRRGLAIARELGLLIGAIALAVVFLISWPMMTAGVALALQLQTSRIFWMLDLLASIYLAWLLAEAPPAAIGRAIVMVTIALALARGIYVIRAEHGGDPIVRIGLPENDWMDAMHWIAKTNLN